jgi:hypothetical protein
MSPSSCLPAGVSPVRVAARRPGSRLAASGGNARCRSPTSKALFGGSDRPARSIKRILQPREASPVRGQGGAEPLNSRRRPMEGAEVLEVQALRNPPG